MIGDHVNFIYQGQLWWRGTKDEVMKTGNQELDDFIFATELTKRLRT
jgi:phospholipid/cholesterol/gamma-HCH transport system ATP-binding protein